MITKYKTIKYYPAKIEAVECARETAKCIFVVGKYGRKEETKCAKESEYEQYHDSWEEAHQHLLTSATSKLEAHKRQVDEARSSLELVKALQAPKAKP